MTDDLWSLRRDGAFGPDDYDVTRLPRERKFVARYKKIRISCALWPTIPEAIAEADKHRTKT